MLSRLLSVYVQSPPLSEIYRAKSCRSNNITMTINIWMAFVFAFVCVRGWLVAGGRLLACHQQFHCFGLYVMFIARETSYKNRQCIHQHTSYFVFLVISHAPCTLFFSPVHVWFLVLILFCCSAFTILYVSCAWMKVFRVNIMNT